METISRVKPRVLTDGQVAHYCEKGYVLVRNAVPPELLETLRSVIDELIAPASTLTESTPVIDLEAEHTPDDPKVRRLRNPIVLHEIFREIALRGTVPGAVADLIGPNVKFHHNKVNIKVGRHGSAAKWHQDYVFTPQTNHDFVAAAIAVDDCLIENGCVYAVPGSHRGRAYSHYDGENFVGCITEELDPALVATAEPMELRAGDMSIHHCVTIHGSSHNTSPNRRRLLINQYAAADAYPLTANSSATEFDGYIVAGERAKFARLDAGTVLMPPDHSKGYRSVFALQAELDKKKKEEERILREF